MQQTIQDHSMLEETRTLLVAVSGGPDSMALLHALYRLRDSFPVQLIVAHLNHRMRTEAATDAQFVAARAQEFGLPYVSAAIDVPAYRQRHKLSPEDAARRVRYAFLQATAAEHQAQRIALGHTANDQAETVLLRMLRGTGPRGLAGIPPVRGSIIRPLIRVHRHEVLTFLRAHGVPFREDPTNQQREYRRNQVRLDLLPLLQQRYNPRIVEALCSLADLLAADEAALRLAAQQGLQAARVQGSSEQVQLWI
ncbi:MAG: tRNA lysidine(34) synthetase TilS, partial [Candidatus Entotheonellia bacterium]